MAKYKVVLASFPGESYTIEASLPPSVHPNNGHLELFDDKGNKIAEFVNWSNWQLVKESNG